MPKMKSHSGTRKRVKSTGTGKLMTNKAARRHLLLRKSKKQKKSVQDKAVSGGDQKRMKKLLPYGA